MAQQRLGIIMNGVTGRMGTNQHLVRSILAIREQGGLRIGDETYLPEPILKRPKQGFMFPLASWIKGPLLPVLRRLIAEGAVIDMSNFDPAKARAIAGQ